MCGIVGATSNRNVVPILIEGIRRLEYRGYDSTGLAVIDGGDGDTAVLERLVSTARVADLAAQAEAMHLEAFTGISHTRWATHGAPTPDNAHPHLSGGEVAVVHNGIIENYEELRDRLKARGYVFRTQTDTEVIAHLVHAHWHGRGGGDLLAPCSVRSPSSRAPTRSPSSRRASRGRVVGARQGSPLRRRHRRARPLPRLRRLRADVGHASRRVSRGRRRRRRAPRVLRDLRRARASASSAASSTCRAAATPSSSGPTGTSCRRRSSSSRARSPTRSRTSRRSRRRCSARRPRRSCPRSIRC